MIAYLSSRLHATLRARRLGLATTHDSLREQNSRKCQCSFIRRCSLHVHLHTTQTGLTTQPPGFVWS